MSQERSAASKRNLRKHKGYVGQEAHGVDVETLAQTSKGLFGGWAKEAAMGCRGVTGSTPRQLSFRASGAAEDGEEVEMSYDAMLRLGEEIGDVKQERWALVAQQHIDKIPTLKFHPSMAEGKEKNHTEKLLNGPILQMKTDPIGKVGTITSTRAICF